jgi:putative hemolysin
MIGLVILMSLLAIVGCDQPEASPTATPTAEVDMSNPASAYCIEQGYRWEIYTPQEGDQYGVCIFPDGSVCEEWAFYRGECGPGSTPPTATPTEVPPTTEIPPTTAPTATATTPSGIEAAYEGVRFFYDPAIASSATWQTVPAEEYMSGDVIPEHIAFSFNGYPLSNTFHQPRIYIYPVSEFSANSQAAANTIDALRDLLNSGQLPAPGGGFGGQTLPFLPLFNAGQLLHTQVAFVSFQSGQGVRYLTEYAQYYAPINNTDLFYTFQGLTADERFYVAAIFPVSHPSLPADGSEIPGGDFDAFANNYDTYISDVALELDAYDATSFTPSLSLLDGLFSSLEVVR